MPLLPPSRPLKGQPIPDNWFGDFYDYVQTLRLVGDGATTTVHRDAFGTIVRAPFATAENAASAKGGSSFGSSCLVAKITADNDDGTYEAEAQKNSSGTFADRDASTYTFDVTSVGSGYLYELNGKRGVPTGTFVFAKRVPDADGQDIWYFDSNQASYGAYQGGAWVEITAGTGPYSWKQLDADASTDTSPAVTGTSNLYEVEGRAGIKVGSIVWAVFDGTNFQTTYHGAPSGTKQDLRRTQATGGSVMSNSWDRSAQGTAFGTKVNLITGLFADASADKLYSYYRTLEINANGAAVLGDTELSELVGCITTITCGGSGTPPSSGIVAHYPFEEGSGTTVADISGNGRDGSTVGGMSWDSSPAVGSYAGDFDGSDDYVDLPSLGIDNIDEAITIAAWVKLDNTSADYFIVANGDGDNPAGRSFLYVYAQSGGTLIFGITSSQTGVAANCQTSISSGSWVHVAVTKPTGRASSGLSIYINGSLSVASHTSTTASAASNIDDYVIGGRSGSEKGTDLVAGSIDDVRIYDSELSASEILDIYNGV